MAKPIAIYKQLKLSVAVNSLELIFFFSLLLKQRITLYFLFKKFPYSPV